MTQPEPSPVVAEFVQREQEVAVTMIVDLIERLEKAYDTLQDMVPLETSDHEKTRLEGKANGVLLALSYAREAIRL